MSPLNVGSTFPVRRLRTSVALLCLGFASLVAQPVQTQTQTTQPDALQFFKNYFVTGSHVVGGVGLQGRGVNGVATGSIPMYGAPEGADIVAAFLYWQAVTKDGTGNAGATGVKFGPWASSALAAPGAGIPLSSEDGVLGKILGTGTPPCWSGGGGTGSSGGTQKTYTYRTDVLRFLHIDEATGKYKVNGAYQVQLPDDNQVKALGASLVVIYRDTDTTKPLKAIVLYDGAYTMDQSTEGMFQSIKGFYDGGASARLTHIVGSGQANKSEVVRFNGTAVATNPFSSSTGPGWDNPTFTVDPNGVALVGLPTAVTTSVDHEGFSTFDCLTWAAVIYETPVKDTDGDGLLDAWEAPTPPSDPYGQTLPNLYAMGARADHKDVFIEIGYMKTDVQTSYGGGAAKDPHSHLPTPAAIMLMGDAFKNAPVDPDPSSPTGYKGIKLHVDVGDNQKYQTGEVSQYIVPAALARGGEFLDESITTTGCTRIPGVDSVWKCQFSAYPGTVGWKTGFRYIRDDVIGTTDGSPIPATPRNPQDDDPCDALGSTCVKRFDANRSDMFRYAFFAHAVGMPKSLFACLDAGGGEVADVDGFCPADTTENPLFFTPRTNSGIADFPGRDILVTLGAFSDRYGLPGGTDFMVASTFFHELGHNIELRHGAAQATAGGPVVPAPNCIPTYLSSMNYLYQLRGLLDDSGKPHLDFSSAIGSTLDDRIDEAGGADVALSFTTPYRIGWYAPLWKDRNGDGQLDPGEGSYFAYPDPAAPGGIGSRTTVAGRHCDGSLMSSTGPLMVRVDARTAGGAIDWNANGILDDYAAQDLNFNGRTTPAGATAELPQAFNDWANIRLNQLGSGRNIGGPFIDADGHRSFGPLSADLARADWARADWARADWARADWARADWARADWARADWGDLHQGDTVRYSFARADWARADWARADWARADWARADWARADWGRGDDSRGDLGGGDLFVGNPNIAGGELDFETATDLARTPPNEFTACAIGGEKPCPAPTGISGVLVTFKAPNIGGVTGYSIYRVQGNTLLPRQTWDPVAGSINETEPGNYTLVDGSAGYGAEYTYFAVATYADGIRSDPSNLVTLTTPTLAVATAAPVTGLYNGSLYSGEGTCSDGLVPVFTYAAGAPPVNAGTTDFTVTCSGSNYITATATATIEISPAASLMTVSCPASVTYTGSAQTPCTAQATGVGIVSPIDVSASLAYLNNVNAGLATATASWPGDANHTGNTGAGGFTIGAASSMTTVICPEGVTYTGAPQTPCSASYTTADGLSGSLAVSYTANTDAGQASATATYAGDANHSGSAGSGGFTIAKATPLFSSLGAPTIFAGATPTVLGGTISAGSLIPGGTVSITLNGQTQSPTISATGAFSSSFPTGALTAAGSPYTITYAYSPPATANFMAAGDDSKRLTVQQPYALVGLQNVPPVTITKTKAGSAVPMKWQFKNGSIVVNSSQVGHRVTVTGPASFVVSNTDPGGSSFRYDATTNSWAFNLQTKGANGVAYPTGNYTVTITPTTPGFSPSPPFTLTLTK